MVQNGRPLGNMVIKLGLDSSAFSDSLTGAARATKTAVKEMQAGFKIADAGGNKIKALAAKQDGLTKVIQAQKNELKYLGDAYKKTLDEQGNATSKTAKAAQKYNEAQAKLASYEAQLKTTTAQMARMRVETEGLTGWLNKKGDQWIESGKKITKFGDGVQKVGSTMTKALTVPLATGFTLATKKAADFQTQIGEIGPLLTNGGAITEKYRQQLDQMSDSSKKWAKQYGISTTEINNGLAEVVRKGYDANQTMGVMPSILDATKASGEDFNDVMNVTTEVISQFGLKGKTYNETLTNAARVTDSLTYVANATSAGFSDLGLAMGYVGPVANSLGMDVEETASAVGLLSDAGLGGEKAGTALRGALTRLLKPSKQNAEGFERLGISVKDFKDGTLTLPDMLDKIKTNTSGWTDAQRTAAIALAFGTESQSAMNVLVNQGGDALRGLTKDTKNASGATKDIAKSMNDLPANKAARFKESLNVLAITVGEKLLPVVTPWIEKATDMVNKFSELDDATQQNIIKWGALAMAAGPTLKIIGSGISIFGKAKTGVGLLSKGLVELAAKSAEKKALTGLAMNVTKVGTAASTAAGVGGSSGGIAALTAGLSGVAVPAAIAVGGIAAVGVALYAANKAYESNQLAGARWGTKVTKEQDKVIKKAYELNEKASTYVNEYADGIVGSAEKAKKANQEIVESIQKVLDKELERKKKAAENITDSAEKKKAENYIKWQETVNKAEVEQAKKKVDAINQVLTNASKNNRNLSNEERQFIANNYKLLSQDQLKAAGFSKKQRLAIETAYQADLSKLQYKDLSKRQQTLQNALKDEKSAYEKQVESLKTIYAKNPQALKASMDKLNKEYKQSTDTLVTGLAKVFQAQGKDISQLSEVWKAYGYTTDEVLSLVNTSVKASSENLDLLAKGTSEADMAWNALALDPKTGEVKTNMAETLVDMAKTDEGWQQLKFMLKNADIESNAKEEVAVAMGLAGKWNTMYMTDKLLTVNGDEAKVALYDTIDELKAWNEYKTDRKVLGADNADVIWKLIDSEEKLNVWNTIPSSDKKLLADNTDFLSKLIKSEEALNQWKSLPDSQKKILADNTDLLDKVFSSTESFKAWGELPEPVKNMLGNNKDILAKVKDGTISVETYNKNVIPALKILFGDGKDLQNAISGATSSINRYNNNVFPNDKTAVGHDRASGAANDAYNAFRNFMNNIPDTVTKTAKVNFIGPSQYEKGTNYHLGGPAIVNDQKGLTYKELVLPKGGIPFIPEGRDVFLPNLPKGSKIIPARQTKKLVPHYKDGVGVPKNSTLVRNLENIRTQNSSSKTEINIDQENYSEQLNQIIKLMGRFSSDLKNMKFIIDHKVLGVAVTDFQNAEAKRKEILKKGRASNVWKI
ncbi:phage tail tape measure protein [Enterococcus sp. SMC-9]|uniref:phage tail tape measure protein n=1 Tax=Enterococcus sp. SMC-9 TaxID=2862343 RepID=UPI001E5D6EA0|nr:phage tail tape measure protein [Enterococcus sp. SMC-9]